MIRRIIIWAVVGAFIITLFQILEARIEYLPSESACRDLVSQAILDASLKGKNLCIEEDSACMTGASAAAQEAGVRLDVVRPDADGRSDVPMLVVNSGKKSRILLARITGPAGNCLSSVSKEGVKWWSVLPPLFAVLAALATRKVLLSIAGAVWLGSILSNGFDWTLGLSYALENYVWKSLSDEFNLAILIFTICLVGVVKIASVAGGSAGIAELLTRLARGAKSVQLSTMLLGLAVFFDDYSNTVVVGSTMRPITDRYRVSRQKLAYIVDSTAAPIAGLAFISTWIGYEVGLFEEVSSQIGLGMGGYGIFLDILPSRFYCLFTIFFVTAIAASGRDFGPMLKAEIEARRRSPGFVGSRKSEAYDPMVLMKSRGVSPAWWVAVIPVGLVLMLVLVGQVISGSLELASDPAWARESANASFFTWCSRCFEKADGGYVLMISSLVGTLVVAAAALIRRRELIVVTSEDETGPEKANRVRARDYLAALIITGIMLCCAALLRAGGGIRAENGMWGDALVTGSMVLIAFLGIVLLITMITRAVIEKTGRRVQFALDPGVVAGSWLESARGVAPAIGLLILAWSIRRVCDDLGTSEYLISALSGRMLPLLFPISVFILAGGVAFATGTSWGAMGILIPTVLPLAYHMGGLQIFLLSAGAILDGAIFGDHCSPISDTTVMSSLATRCDHIEHVKTQIPYAVCGMLIAGLAGYMPAAAGLGVYWSYLIGAGCIAGIIYLLGSKSDVLSRESIMPPPPS